MVFTNEFIKPPVTIRAKVGGSNMGKNFIKGAIKHPGALHKELGVPLGQKIPQKKMAGAASKGGLLGKRARFAEELSGFAHDKKPKPDGTY